MTSVADRMADYVRVLFREDRLPFKSLFNYVSTHDMDKCVSYFLGIVIDSAFN